MILSVVELLLLALALGAVLRIALKAPFRRDLRELPRPWVVLGLVLAKIGLLLGVWAVVRWAPLRHTAVIVSSAVMIAAWIRARPRYGHAWGWPPGSLGVGRSVDAIYDRRYYLDQVAEHGPVFKMSQFGRPVACVYGLKRARALLASQGDALVGAALPYNRSIGKGALRYMSSEAHQQERALFRSALGGLDLAAGEDAIRRSLRRQLDKMSRDSQKSSSGVYARKYFERFLIESLSRVFFGLDVDDPRIDAFEAMLPDIELGRMGGRAWRERIERAMVRATSMMHEMATQASTGEGALPPGTALGNLLRLDPSAIDDLTRARNLFIAFRLANGDVVGLLDWIFTQLSRHPEWQEAVRREPRMVGEPTASQPRDIGSRVVLETLRLEQTEFLYRRVLREIPVEGYTIPAGWLLRVLVHESHQDPEIFPSPERFDPDRFLERTFDKNEYSPFGADVHGCMGARLALFLGRVLAEELSHGVTWEVVRDGPLERGTRHRHHWRPSSLMRVVVRPRVVPELIATSDPARGVIPASRG